MSWTKHYIEELQTATGFDILHPEWENIPKQTKERITLAIQNERSEKETINKDKKWKK